MFYFSCCLFATIIGVRMFTMAITFQVSMHANPVILKVMTIHSSTSFIYDTRAGTGATVAACLYQPNGMAAERNLGCLSANSQDLKICTGEAEKKARSDAESMMMPRTSAWRDEPRSLQ